MQTTLFLNSDYSFWHVLFLIEILIALALGIMLIFRRGPKSEEDTLRKEHRDFSFSYKGKEYLLKDSKILFSIDSISNPPYIWYFVEFPDEKYFGIKFNDFGGEADVTSYTLEEINAILEKKLEVSVLGLINGVF
ncbi:MAG: hypothetical protein NTZ83_00335 [Candidatus Pacearchaeota archaeon]|nr:hypothetical protein [Candidatus Pacearchaeota archaeon]